jgi:ubiquinone/menaquinone biosynthesis C-methylase UbiE
MTLGQRVARVATTLVVRSPKLWPLFRRPVARMFDRIAPGWDAMRRADSLAPFAAALETIEGPVRDALDVGTGTGAGALAVAARFPEATVVGVDVAEGMLDQARRNAPALRFERADASALPFPDASFDLVTHANMIPFVAEAARVLRPGGHVLFAFSAGAETPIYVPPSRLRRSLERGGFADVREHAAGRGTALTARKR